MLKSAFPKGSNHTLTITKQNEGQWWREQGRSHLSVQAALQCFYRHHMMGDQVHL